VFAHSAVLLMFLLPLRGLISHIPVPALAAVTAAVGLQLISLQRFRSLKLMVRTDAALFLLTFGLVVLDDLIAAVGVGSVIAMLLFVERAANSTKIEKVTLPVDDFDPTTGESEQIAAPRSETQIYRLTGPFFFASSEQVLACLTRETTPKILVLDLTRAGPIDSAATACLRQLATIQRSRGGELHLIGLDERLLASIEERVTHDDDATASSDHVSLTSHRTRFSFSSLPGVVETGSTLMLDHNLNKGEK
jgi:SulP family sulfate permease